MKQKNPSSRLLRIGLIVLFVVPIVVALWTGIAHSPSQVPEVGGGGGAGSGSMQVR